MFMLFEVRPRYDGLRQFFGLPVVFRCVYKEFRLKGSRYGDRSRDLSRILFALEGGDRLKDLSRWVSLFLALGYLELWLDMASGQSSAIWPYSLHS